MGNIIKKEELDLELQVRFLIADINRISLALDKNDKELDKSKTDTQRDKVIDSLSENIIKYSVTVSELREKLEEWFIWESSSGLPVNLTFKRYYKRLFEK